MATDRKVTIWGKVDPEIKILMDKIAAAQGITISEYVRMLVTADLDKRTFFTDKVKEDLEESDQA